MLWPRSVWGSRGRTQAEAARTGLVSRAVRLSRLHVGEFDLQVRIEGHYKLNQEAIYMKWATEDHGPRLIVRDATGTWRNNPFLFQELNIPDTTAEEWLAAVLRRRGRAGLFEGALVLRARRPRRRLGRLARKAWVASDSAGGATTRGLSATESVSPADRNRDQSLVPLDRVLEAMQLPPSLPLCSLVLHDACLDVERDARASVVRSCETHEQRGLHDIGRVHDPPQAQEAGQHGHRALGAAVGPRMQRAADADGQCVSQFTEEERELPAALLLS